MRVLLDHCAPRKLRAILAPLEVVRSSERERDALRDGDLLRRADPEFDVLLTLDGNMPFQNNLAGLQIAVVVIKTFDPSGMNLWLHADEIRRSVSGVSIGEFTILRLH